MRFSGRRFLVLMLSLVMMAVGAFWATSSLAAPVKKNMLPVAAAAEDPCDTSPIELEHEGSLTGLGTFTEVPSGEPTRLMVEVENHFISRNGLKTVPLKVVSIGGKGFAEGIGETRFWLDATRPVTGAIWEKRPGTEFPAIQEMRFHFFYTVEAMPGKVFRSINPARMRSDNVTAFPPTPGTVYRLVEPVKLEDISDPGVVVGSILSNRAVIPSRDDRPTRQAREE